MADSSREFIGEYPVSTTLSAFAVGFGVGIAAVYLLGGESRHRHDLGLADKLGRRVLDAIANAVPESLMHLGR
jgi:hypothetical protein